MRVMFSTVHIENAVIAAIPKLSPDKIVFLLDPENEKRSDLQKIKAKLQEMKNLFSKVIEIEMLETPAYDIVKTAIEVAKRIEEEHKKKNEVILHITEGRKTMAMAAMYAAYARKSMVKGIYYITEEKNELVSLPVLEFTISSTKKSILNDYRQGIKGIKELAKRTNKTEAMIYAHISSLKAEGYISPENELTVSGQIVII